jgi:hypothetical protein
MILWRTPLPRSTRGETYRDHRRRTLNFESRGGEPHSQNDITLQPMGQIYFFLAQAAKKAVERSH